MDPIHPITPRPPALTPIGDGWGSNPGDRATRERRNQRRRAANPDGSRPQHTHEPNPANPDEEDGGARHIDVRA